MTQERYWYQDGWTILAIGFGALLIYGCHQQKLRDSKPLVTPLVAGRINRPFLGSPSFEIEVWHQHAGKLRNGSLFVSLTSPLSKQREGKDGQIHSFELWEPNQAHAVKFNFPLSQFDPDQEIVLDFDLFGAGIKHSTKRAVWLGNGWKD